MDDTSAGGSTLLPEAAQPDAPQTETAAPPPPKPSPLRTIFFGPLGLRAGWSLLLFVLLIAAFFGAIWLSVHLYIVHHPALRASMQQKQQKAAVAAPMPPQNILLSHGVPLALFLLASWVMTKIERRRFGVYGLGGVQRLPDCLKGLLTGLLSLSLLVGLLWANRALVFTGFDTTGGTALLDALLWLAGFALVGVGEEYVFRGYMQYTLARGLSGLGRTLGFWIAAVLLSGLFLAGHVANPGESPVGLLSVFLVGGVLAYSLWRTGSLWWAIGFHTAWDWAQSFLYGVADSGLVVKGHLLVSHPQGNLLISGGTTGPEGSLYIVPVLVMVALTVHATTPRREPPALLPETALQPEPMLQPEPTPQPQT